MQIQIKGNHHCSCRVQHLRGDRIAPLEASCEVRPLNLMQPHIRKPQSRFGTRVHPAATLLGASRSERTALAATVYRRRLDHPWFSVPVNFKF